ncbi:gliding motility lipoprotein GldD [Flavobacteriaceae bacterium F08102]|nr:gliding motility lipoprotein GldD [Flavobacteriaceae bacterium F08102]
MNKVTLQLILCAFVIPIFWSCEEDPIPKPKAFLRLSYQEATYQPTTANCPYSFEVSSEATANSLKNCWMNIKYPKLKATINLTYRPVENNLNELLMEAEKLTYNHAIKADGISTQPFVNTTDRKFGALSEVTGNAASPLQFHLTDSTDHFITGAVYFAVRPNFDSILPAIKYIEKDVIHMMESLQWKKDQF